ncbi:MAG: hypothetical protein J5659_03335, partial [Clostridia bacterium]|nr:hypothetical protein [Clostridia bacterium]
LYGQKVEQNAPLYGQKVEQNAPLYGQKVEQNAPLYGQKVEQSDNKGRTKRTPFLNIINNSKNNSISSSSFDGSKSEEKEEEEEKNFLEGENNNNYTPAELEQQALADVQKIFSKSDEEKAREEKLKESFVEFWTMFAPDNEQKRKYKVAQNYWCNEMEDYRRAAVLKFLRQGFKSTEPNPFYFIQHFSPVRVFITTEREQYQLAKTGTQLCRVRWKDTQRVTSAYWAELFGLDVLDEHYEKKFLCE